MFSTIVLFLLALIILYIANLNAKVFVISRWHHLFEKFQYSPKDFYATLQEILNSRNIPGTTYSRVTRREGGVFTDEREYLQIKRGLYLFEICAAPFGTGFFISWWYMDKPGILRILAGKSAYLASLMDIKTFFQMDTESMFQDTVQGAVKEAIGIMTNTKGVRGPSELEFQPTINLKYSRM